jgi:hypothetical protein
MKKKMVVLHRDQIRLIRRDCLKLVIIRHRYAEKYNFLVIICYYLKFIDTRYYFKNRCVH